MNPVAANLAQVRAAIHQACGAAGRDARDVRLLPVTKTHPVAAISQAMAAGCAEFGENRVQELAAKAAVLPEARWVVIGHLQRNKAGVACALAHEVQSVDSLRLAEALQRHLDHAGGSARLRVMVEVNTSGEATKAGVAPDQVGELTAQLRGLDHLDVVGLMTVAHPDPDRADHCFATLAELRERLRQRDGTGWDELSMGMSGDFAAAIRHGSTCLRIGTAIFGARPLA
jgi:pyridoxal phosphate enzyme (YggS family)